MINTEERAFLRCAVDDKSPVFLHSSLSSLGDKPVDVAAFIEEFFESLGRDATLVMPTFSFQFNEEKFYDPIDTKCGTGKIPETFRKMTINNEKVLRNLNPMQSIAAVGKHSRDLVRMDCETTFGNNSAFDKLLKLDGTIVLLGCDYNKISFYHYLEEQLRVPYRYWKTFSGSIKINDKLRTVDYKMFVRKLEYLPNINHFGMELEKQGKVEVGKIGSAIVRILKFRDIFEFLKIEMEKDPMALVNTNRDEWGIRCTEKQMKVL